jgi:myo-inositol 2-dehydrogenase / D-chiro-inositol 1-dehydrogenase
MEPVRLGVIGVGDMGGYHTLGFSALDEARIVAIADLDTARMAELLAEIPEQQVAQYTDYRRLLDRDDIEAVVVAVPQYLHREITLAALDAGLDILLEKPMAPTVMEADEIIAAHRQTDRIVQIGLEYRYAGLYRQMAQMCTAGEYGQTLMMWCNEMRENFPPREWFYDQSRSGGAITDKCVHYFDLFNWMIGARPRRVIGMGGQHVIRQGEPHLVECTYSFWEPAVISNSTILDHAWVMVEYENGARANLGLCMYLKAPYDGPQVGAITDAGYRLVAQDDQSLTLWGGPAAANGEPVEYDEPEAPWVGHIGAHRARIEFLHSVRSRQAPACDSQSGRDALALCQAAELSIAEDRVVWMEELG